MLEEILFDIKYISKFSFVGKNHHAYSHIQIQTYHTLCINGQQNTFI